MTGEYTSADADCLRIFIEDNPDLERLEAIANKFNIFVSLGLVSNELKHSNFLAWLLNPSENHGLGDYIIRSILKRIVTLSESTSPLSIFDAEVMNLEDLEILREWRNIDLVVINRHEDLIIVIENKVFTGEHSNQLKRYKETMDAEFSDYKYKVFALLSPEGTIASDEDYISISYREILILLNNAIERRGNTLGEEVLIFLKQYVEMLGRYIVDDGELRQICGKIYKAHKRALDLIYEYKPDMQQDISNYLQEIIRADNMLEIDDCSKQFIRFIPKELDNLIEIKGEGWTSTKRILLFEFRNIKELLVLALYIGPGDKEYVDMLKKLAQNNKPLKILKAGRIWTSIWKKFFLEKNAYGDFDLDDMKTKIEQKFNEFKQKDMPIILEVFRKNLPNTQDQ